MLNVRYSTKFKRDFKICVKRGYKIALLQQVIDTFRILAPLPAKNKDHNLSGNYFGYRECHIEPDWLLIYKQTDDELRLDQTDDELRLDQTGTHADLFRM